MQVVNFNWLYILHLLCNFYIKLGAIVEQTNITQNNIYGIGLD
jgi:hypothetical protein